MRMLVLVHLFVWGLPEGAQACAVCFSGTNENRDAFVLTTVFMTALPLLMIGSLVFWMVRRARKLEATSHSDSI